MIPPGIEPIVEELLVVLDDETELLEVKRSQLADLSKMLLRSDNESVEVLLKQIEQAEETQLLLERRLQTLRETLAGAFGRQVSEFNLSWLITQLPRPRALTLIHRRQKLSCKVDEFRKQHMQTTILLTECSRITGLMLDSLSPSGTVITYGAEGSDRWRVGAGLMDMER
ncbi:MAG: hypothetical protein GY794_13855 [bacterium]|nr:hypothetical protein [bacterium]